MAGGTVLLAIVGLVALLAGGCELIRAMWRAADRRRGIPIDLTGPAPDYPCPFPRLEPEVENLRKKAAL